MKPTDIINNMDKRYALFGFLFALNNRLQTIGDQFYEEITCKQFFLMACLNLFPDEPPTLQELSQVMGCSHQNVKSIAGRLQEKGLVSIRADGSDKRKQRIYLTEKAGELAAKYNGREKDFMDRLFDGLTEERVADTFAALTRLEENLIEIGSNL